MDFETVLLISVFSLAVLFGWFMDLETVLLTVALLLSISLFLGVVYGY